MKILFCEFRNIFNEEFETNIFDEKFNENWKIENKYFVNEEIMMNIERTHMTSI